MKGTHYIDFTQAEMPAWWQPHWPLKIKVRNGRALKEWDMVVSSVPRKVYTEMVNFCKSQKPAGTLYVDAPIGFNSWQLPKGAMIREADNG